jgi:hypothetical protein
MKVAFRGFVGFDLIFQEMIEVNDYTDCMKLAMSHIDRMLVYDRFLIELEFVEDAPRPDRFVRFGTDTTRMVEPKPIFPLPD